MSEKDSASSDKTADNRSVISEAEDTKWVKFLTELVSRAHEAEASKVELCFKEGANLEVRFIPKLSSKEVKTQNIPCNSNQWKRLAHCILHRTGYWPALDENGSPLAHKRPSLKMFLLINNTLSFLADLFMEEDSETKEQKFRFDDIEWGTSTKLSRYLDFSVNNKSYFKSTFNKKLGIVLANRTNKKYEIDGCSISLTRRPLARLCQNIESKEDIQKALIEAKTRLVIIAFECEDPVEMLFEGASYLGHDKALIEEFFTQVHAVIVHKSASRTCRSCGQSVMIDGDIIDKLPEILRPSSMDSEVVGEGCDDCRQSGYLGMVGFHSILYLEDSIRKLLLEGGSPAQVTEIAYRNGTRCLLEDALEKAANGFTTYKEILRCVNKITPAFLNAIASRTSNSEQTPGEIELEKNLESIDDGFFLAKKEHNHDEQVVPIELKSEFKFKKDVASSEKEHEPILPVKQAKQRLLLVEDDRDQREMLSLILETEGYEVITAANGKEALKALQISAVEIIVCDLMMPEMNGEELVRTLRNTKQYQHTPILMLTAVQSEKVEYNLLSAGADDYCTKGTSRSLILKRIERVLARSTNPLSAT